VRGKLEPLLGEAVLRASTAPQITTRLGGEQSLLDERFKRREYGARTADGAIEVLEAPHTVNASRSTSRVHFSPTTSNILRIEQVSAL